MVAQCLSVLGPCDQICAVCEAAYEDYKVRVRKQSIAHAIEILEAAGYRVEPTASVEKGEWTESRQ